MRIVCTLIFMLLFSFTTQAATPVPVVQEAEVTLDENADRLIYVKTEGTGCHLSLYAKQEEGWALLIEGDGYIGKNGIGKEKEGDKKTPEGLFRISSFAFGREENPGTSLPYVKVTDHHYWCGDSESVLYDQMVDTTVEQRAFDRSKSENLYQMGIVYDYCLNIEYNKDHTPYKGSALFVHCNRYDGEQHTTSGCVAVDRAIMKTLICELTENTWILLN